MKEKTITITLDSALAQYLDENLIETTPEELAATILTAHFVDEGAPVPSCYGVGSRDFLTAAHIAMDDFLPLAPIVERRRNRVVKAVSEAFSGDEDL